MKFRNIKSIEEYRHFINYLNPKGFYQIRLYCICFIYWAFSGLNKTIFELAYQKTQSQNQIICTYGFLFSHAMGLLLFSKIALHKGRKLSIFTASAVYLLGCIMILIWYFTGIRIIGFLGTSCSALSIYAIPFMMITLVCEYIKQKYLPFLTSISLLFFCSGKVLGIYLLHLIQNNNQSKFCVFWYILLPIGLLSIGFCYFFYESPRYLHINNYLQSQLIMKKIIDLNKCPEYEQNWAQSFLWQRLNIKKYGFNMLFSYSSLDLPQYSLIGCFFLLGMISKYPTYFLSLDVQPHSSYFSDQILSLWICAFQITALLVSSFCLSVYKRKRICIVMSVALVLISGLFYFCHQKVSVVLDLTLLALNAFFSITLYAFLIVNSLQFFPHSVRVIGAGLVISAYYMGMFVFYFYLYSQISSHFVIQFFLLASCVLGLYTYGLQQTLENGFKYEIKEIQVEQEQQY